MVSSEQAMAAIQLLQASEGKLNSRFSFSDDCIGYRGKGWKIARQGEWAESLSSRSEREDYF
jgi:hypothetical protein